MAEQLAIEVKGLRKRYREIVAVDGVDLSVRSGECFGILGPNGAGKTTTIEMIEGIREPDGGEILVLGESPWPRNPSLLPRIGVQLQATSFIDKLTAAEQLDVFGKLYGAPPKRVEELLDLVGLADMGDVRSDKLSGGQQQRLSTACALVGEPEIVFLDEPSAGLDPSARRRLWEVIESVNGRGVTVILTTHYMDEAEALCDRVAIMDRGRVLAVDPPAELIRALNAPTRILLPPGAMDTADARLLPSVVEVEVDSGALTMTTRDPAALIGALADANALSGIQIRSATLEDAFIEMTGRPFTDPDSEDSANLGSNDPGLKTTGSRVG